MAENAHTELLKIEATGNRDDGRMHHVQDSWFALLTMVSSGKAATNTAETYSPTALFTAAWRSASSTNWKKTFRQDWSAS